MIKHTSGLYEFHIIPGINKSIKTNKKLRVLSKKLFGFPYLGFNFKNCYLIDIGNHFFTNLLIY